MTCRLTFSFAIITLLFSFSAEGQESNSGPSVTEQNRFNLPANPELLDFYDEERSLDDLLSEMSLREKVGQLFAVRAYGTFLNAHDPDFLRLERLVKRYHIGGILFFQGDIYGQAHMNNRLQSASKIPLLISQDMEFGAAMRIEGTTRFTPAMGIAATNNPYNAYLKGKITAAEAKSIGVQQIYAPVLDVNNNPENPVINVRSYSADPETVAEYGIRFMEGVESEGVLSTGKHFPGHGDTNVDSHLALPVIDHEYARLDTLELIPFRRAIEKGMKSIMSSHIAFPKISKTPGIPGTLDETILRRILVDSLNFEGLIVTDGLEMRGITDHYSPGEAVVMALNAGADMMLVSTDEMAAINEILMAVERGQLSEERINRSVKKILEVKRQYRPTGGPFVRVESLAHTVATSQYKATADRIARESITLLKNDDILPIRQFTYPDVVVLGLFDGRRHSSLSVLARELRRYHSGITVHTLDERTGADEMENIRSDLFDADLVITASFLRTHSLNASSIPQEQIDLLEQIGVNSTPHMVISFGSPYIISDFQSAETHILAWSGDAQQVINTIPALFAASDVGGVLPADIPDLYGIGDGLQLPQSTIRHDRPLAAGLLADSLINIDMIMQHAIDDSVFPGGVVGVMRNGALVWQEAYGYHDYSKTKAVRPNDVFDMASITKIKATTAAIMKLVNDGLLSLDDPVHEFIPEFDTEEKRKITIRHFLLHTSGLPAYRIYVDKLRTRDELIEAVRNEPLINPPGEEYIYSDLGFILLAEIIEEVTGKRIDQYLQDEFYEPMDMRSTTFNPLEKGADFTQRIPPTEIDTVYNRGLVHKKVHDERAYFMDGISGHAGLFSNVQDMSKFFFMLLNDGVYGGVRYLSPEIINQFTTKQSPINQRGLGFDRKSEDFSTAGTLTSNNSYGHTGFTGTSFWVDPEENLAIIILTNRTFPNRSYGSRISEIRAEIADTVMRSIRY